MSEQYCTTKGLGWAFLICAFFILGVPVGMWLALEGAFFILGVPVLMWLAIEGSDWYEIFKMMNPI